MPKAMGKSKRPDSLGKSAGARLTVMRLAGNSKRAFCSAARTRSLDSLTSVSGKPTMVKQGRPLARWTSTVTCGASMPASARLFRTARLIGWTWRAWLLWRGRSGSFLADFEFGHAGFQLFQFGAGLGQYLCLDVEFFAGHQVQLGKALA